MVWVGRTNPSYLSCQFHELKTLFHDSYQNLNLVCRCSETQRKPNLSSQHRHPLHQRSTLVQFLICCNIELLCKIISSYFLQPALWSTVIWLLNHTSYNQLCRALIWLHNHTFYNQLCGALLYGYIIIPLTTSSVEHCYMVT